MSECFVYVIAIDELRISKVGISYRPVSRLQQLQTGSPHLMRLAHSFRLPQRDIAIYVEQSFHAAQSVGRLRGEWFSIEAERATLICSVAIDSFMDHMVGMDDCERQAAWQMIGVPPERVSSGLDWQDEKAFRKTMPRYQPKGVWKDVFVWKEPATARRTKLRPGLQEQAANSRSAWLS
jgi:hypothetical protein